MFPSKGMFRSVFFQPYNDRSSATLPEAVKNSKHLVQRIALETVLENHQGCVNSVQWNDTGSLLLTAGDDKHLVITNPFTYKIVFDYKTKHKSNIFCAKFLPTTDDRIISCSGDGAVLSLDLGRIQETEWNFFSCHSNSCYELETIPGELNTFLSCSEDGTVRQYDLRNSSRCSKKNCSEHVFINCGKPVSSIAINPIRPYQLAIATVDSTVRIVDRRKIMKQDSAHKIIPECSFTVPHLDHRSYRITSLSYSPDGRDMLASYSNEEVYLFSLDKCSNVTAVANDFLENAPNPPPYRRIRLRGDWSDTGPQSRPLTDPLRNSMRMQTALMERMSDMLIHVFNTPSLRSAIMQNWRPNNTPAATLIRFRRRNQNLNESDITLNTDVVPLDDARFFQDVTVSNDNNSEQSTSNSINQSADNKMEKTKELSTGFDDFIPLQPIKAQYKGHRNARTLIKKAAFWGSDFIMSGSDCGHVFIWDRDTCEIVMVLPADSHVVNCIRPHPSRPILATSGIDHNVKLWSPISENNMFCQFFVDELVEKNKIMLKESRDTLTVSPSLIVRMLAYFNQIRQDRNDHPFEFIYLGDGEIV